MNSLATLRLFVAVPVPPDLEGDLDVVLKGMSNHRQVRWVSRAQLHITLRFIGDFEESFLARLESVLGKVASSTLPFEAEIGGLNAFPRMEQARVLFIPVTRGDEDFRRLEKALTVNLAALGIRPDVKEYHPHLTLGRVRENENPKAAQRALQEVLPPQWPPWRADRFILFKSQLAAGGSVYTRLVEFKLGV